MNSKRMSKGDDESPKIRGNATRNAVSEWEWKKRDRGLDKERTFPKKEIRLDGRMGDRHAKGR